jgi:hypothetical protein
MITAYVKRDNKKSVVEYRITGHANCGEYGRDVVCSAVSVLAQAIIIGLTKTMGIKPDYSIDGGDLYCAIPPLDEKRRREADLLLDTMFYTLKSIRDSYPENISIFETEV